MQVTPEKIKAQQLVLFHLGFYKGVIDGVWSQKTIDAKLKFEADPQFLPAYPNRGLPFGDRDKLPKNMRYDQKGLIVHTGITPERRQEIEDAMAARLASASVKVDASLPATSAPRVVQPSPRNELQVEDTVAAVATVPTPEPETVVGDVPHPATETQHAAKAGNQIDEGRSKALEQEREQRQERPQHLKGTRR